MCVRAEVESAALEQIDMEIGRLYERMRRAADAFDREFARLKIDALLERRFRISGRQVGGVPADPGRQGVQW